MRRRGKDRFEPPPIDDGPYPVGTEDLEIVLRRIGSLQLQVLGADGEPVERFGTHDLTLRPETDQEAVFVWNEESTKLGDHPEGRAELPSARGDHWLVVLPEAGSGHAPAGYFRYTMPASGVLELPVRLPALASRTVEVVDEDGQGRPVLVGNDDSGGHHCHPFDADSLATALRERRLLPSVFSSFLVLALARGVNCLGGYHQADYLPAMQRGVVAVLRGIQADQIAEAVTAMPTGGYLGGMQALLLERPEGLVPAGVIEMLATGRLDGALLERIDALTVDDAHRASLTDTCVEMLCRDALPADLHAQVAAELRTASGPQPVIARA